MTREEAKSELMQIYMSLSEEKKQALDVAFKALQEPTGHWIDNHNGTISCSHCHTWFNKDDRYYYMLYCPYCNVKMTESEPQERSEDAT